MKRGRRVPFVLFVVCLVAAMPYAWGQVGLEDVTLEPFVSLEGAKIDALKVGVTLCHIPPGNPANAHTIVVGEAAVAAHLAHGDSLGACPQACGIPAAVPKTGQTRCWGRGPDPYDVFPIDCAGTGQDGEYQKGVAVDPRFTDNADGTVKDNLTGLIWLKDANCFGGQVWYDALTLSNTLASGACGLTDGSVAGDWRLPNVKELESLLDRGRTPAVPIAHPFSGVENYNYWSSTTVACCWGLAWNVNLFHGDVLLNGGKLYTYYVWPVRGGQ